MTLGARSISSYEARSAESCSDTARFRSRRVTVGRLIVGSPGLCLPVERSASLVAALRKKYFGRVVRSSHPRARVRSPGVTAEEIAKRIVSGGVAPSCAAGCASFSTSWRREVGGDEAMFFDLASVTKPMTAVAIARAGIAKETPLGALLKEARGTASEHVSIELLLAHRAGLAAHQAFFEPVRGAVAGSVDVEGVMRRAADARRDDARGEIPLDGFAPLYSDVGYILAGHALAQAVGARDAGEAIGGLVLEPLGITDEAGTVRELKARGVKGPFAATEEVAWRGGRVLGAVHDENAWVLTGHGGSGHAGIFSTVGALLKFGSAVLDAWAGREGKLGRADLSWLVGPRPGGTLRAGFDGKSPAGSSAGEQFGRASFGHLGFAGTSLWIDPDANVVVALLTNRVHVSRHHGAIRSARPWAHDALWTRAREISDRHPQGAAG